MGMKVAKFGGSSLADAAQFKKVREILLSDEDRRIVVPSAPGKRFDGDEKVTDLLYRCYRMVELNQSHEEVFARIADRYQSDRSVLSVQPPGGVRQRFRVGF